MRPNLLEFGLIVVGLLVLLCVVGFAQPIQPNTATASLWVAEVGVNSAGAGLCQNWPMPAGTVCPGPFLFQVPSSWLSLRVWIGGLDTSGMPAAIYVDSIAVPGIYFPGVGTWHMNLGTMALWHSHTYPASGALASAWGYPVQLPPVFAVAAQGYIVSPTAPGGVELTSAMYLWR